MAPAFLFSVRILTQNHKANVSPGTETDYKQNGPHLLPTEVIQRRNITALQEPPPFLASPYTACGLQNKGGFNWAYLFHLPFALTFQGGMLSTDCNGPLQCHHRLHIPAKGEVPFYFF